MMTTQSPVGLLHHSGRAHWVDEVSLQRLQRTHLSQLLGVVLSCLLHRQRRVDGDHLAVEDRELGKQVGLQRTEARCHQQQHTVSGGMGLTPRTTWILQVRT